VAGRLRAAERRHRSALRPAGKAQIGKGMWAMPDQMAAMVSSKIVHPRAGASTAWVPSPTAATLHALHYHQVDVFKVQAELASRAQASLSDILQPPLAVDANWSAAEDRGRAQQQCPEHPGVCGALDRRRCRLLEGPDYYDTALMEDRATLRISSQHIANWLHHRICTPRTGGTGAAPHGRRGRPSRMPAIGLPADERRLRAQYCLCGRSRSDLQGTGAAQWLYRSHPACAPQAVQKSDEFVIPGPAVVIRSRLCDKFSMDAARPSKIKDPRCVKDRCRSRPAIPSSSGAGRRDRRSGATKLLPGLFHLSVAGFIPGCRIIGVSLDDIDTDAFRKIARKAVDEFSTRKFTEEAWAQFAAALDYVPLSAGARYSRRRSRRRRNRFNCENRRLHYLSVPPNAALSAVRLLGEAGLVERSRIIMEKPFGTDLASAVSLNAKLHEVFDESQIFRIDHFLGKEPAQNILAFRFANGLFEPIWNRNFINHVQIDVPETLGLGKRAAFYEQTGAYRDMVVTHLFQILAFMAMEPPTALDPKPISEEKNKVFRSMEPIEPQHVVRGQYTGYRSEQGIDPRSDTETFIALKCSDRQLALGRCAVFPANRQASGRRPANHFDRFPRAAQEHVSRRIGHRRAGPGPSDLRSGGRLESVAVLLRQAPRPWHAAGQAQSAIRDA
jgi:hypothetical protein